MASVTRRDVGLKTTVGTLYNPNCNLYLITVKNNGGSAINLQNEDDAVDEVVEMIVKEISPLAYFTVADTSGKIHVVMDKGINDASELQIRIRAFGASTGANGVDVRGTTVEVATSLTIGV